MHLLNLISDRFMTVAARRSDRGASAVEYGLLVGLIAVAIIVAVTLLGTELSTLFTDVANEIPDVP
ncbi:Flp family type IVb pilin [Isoptericola sp. AK164]|uniref:Flp family type IVb pilin n=1 Tax=Isoptericola sp. AK164 TaxID=3024246 RepID=UPI00241839B1|nr:Flp family type IVb pilin [Isoptericola sp. AK164]